MVDGAPDPDRIVGRTDYAEALSIVRQRAGLTVRELARRLGVPSATLGGYFSGRHVPPVAQTDLVTAVLRECGVTDSSTLGSWVAATVRARESSDRRIRDTRPPFRGLDTYQPDDAALFFGRRQETDRLLDLVVDPGRDVVAVVGPSGSGKSSVLRAGLIAAIRAGRLDDQGGTWSCAITTPGGAPLDRLRQGLAELDAAGPSALVIDQIEELFTSRHTSAERQEFFSLLAQSAPGRVVVFGLRADFYSTAARQPVLLTALQNAQVLVGPLRPDLVRETITGPAKAVGLALENGFVDVVLADLGPLGQLADVRSTSSLPLLAHALLATWRRSSGGRLSIADYRATGGIETAVEQTAEQVYQGLSAAGRATARVLFLRLVTVDDLAVTRRRVSWNEIHSMREVGVEETSRQFVAARLLTASSEALEMSHEALLTAWPRLRGWIDEGREALTLRRRIIEAAAEWKRSGRDPALLLRGARLAEATNWAADAPPELGLTADEREYLVEGNEERVRDQVRERRSARRTRQALAAVAALAILAVLLAVVSLAARRTAQLDRKVADNARDNALSRQVAQQATELTVADPALAEQLALAAYRISPTDAARGALTEQLAHPVITRVLGAPGPTALAASKDGRLIAVGHADDGSIHLFRSRGASPPTPAGVIPGGGARAQVFALAFLPDGRTLATGGQSGRVDLWSVDPTTRPTRLAQLTPHFGGAVQTIAVAPDGRRLVAGSSGVHPLLEWALGSDLHDVREVRAPDGVSSSVTIQSVAFNDAGTVLAAGGTGGTLLEWPTRGIVGKRPRVFPADPGSTVDAISFDPGAERLYAGDRAGRLTVWTTRSPRPAVLKTLHGSTDSPINVVAVAPDGDEVATGNADNTLTRWSTKNWEPREAVHNPGPVTGVRYAVDGSTILTTAADGTLRIQRRSERAIPVQGSVFALSFSRDGARLAVSTSSEAGNVRVWDVRNRTQPRPLTAPLSMSGTDGAVDGTGALRPDGLLLAAGNASGQVQLWDLRDPAVGRAVGRRIDVMRALVESLVFSPDGKLLAVAGDDHSITLLDVANPAHPRRIARMAGADLMLGVTFSPDGRLVAGADADNSAYVWDVTSPSHPRLRARLTGFKSYVYGVAFSRDGMMFAATSSDHTTRLWHVKRGVFTHLGDPLIGPTDYVYSATFTPDGRHLAVGSNDGTVRVYTLGGRVTTPAQTLRSVGGPVFAVAYSPDGKSLFGAGRSGSVASWGTDISSYAAQLCPRAGTPITRAEWALYVPGARYAPPCR